MPTVLRRLFLWSLPLAWGVALALTTRYLEASSYFYEAQSCLLAGEYEDAAAIFRRQERSLWYGAQARGGLAIADALMDSGQSAWSPAELDVSRHPIRPLIRQAFDRGDFASCLRLTHLAEELGESTLPTVTAAALIETDQSAAAREIWPNSCRGPERLAQRVDYYLDSPPVEGGYFLADRYGRPLGRLLADGKLEVDPDLAPELVPRAVTRLQPENPAARSLYLTLDREMSEIAFRAFGRYRGSIVLVEPQTGDILAAVSDSRTSRQAGTAAFEDRREPASIAKLITTSATLRAGLAADREISHMTCRGQLRFNGRYLYCPHVAGPLHGLDRAMAISCNVAFADLGVRIGRARMLAELDRYGFGHDLGPFPGGRIRVAQGDARQLADLSIGLDATDVTPLHAALIAAVMGNDGVMPVPALVSAEDGRLGLHPRPRSLTPGHPVVDPAWLPELLGSMEAVALYGTGRELAPADFPVAMKTGTASEPGLGFHVNYIGIGPLPEARIAFAVRITDQPSSRRVRQAAREVTSALLYGLAELARERGWDLPPAAPRVPEVRFARSEDGRRTPARPITAR